MHELSVTEAIRDLALKHARLADAKKITDIHVKIGALSSIVDDSVQFYWEMIGDDPLCSGAKLHFERIPARLTCLDCHNEYRLEDQLRVCPICQSSSVKVIQGEEFFLDCIEVEK